MIAVIGAGPAGLALAWRAALAGHRVVVIERSPHVGGMAASFDVAGVMVDHGSHRLHPSIDPPLLGALRRLLGDDLQTRPRHGRIRLAGRWVAFPLRPGDLVRRLPPRLALGAGIDALAAPLRRPRSDTFAEVVRARLGPTIGRSFYEPYVDKLWATDPGQLAGELARRRVGATGPADLVGRMLRGRSGADSRSTFLYPRTGFGAISEALAEAATAAGAELRLGASVDRIDRSGRDHVTVALGDGTTTDVDMVFSTIPLPALAAAVVPEAPADVLTAGRGLRHRALVLVYIIVDRPQWTEFDAHYFPGPEVPASRVSEPKNYRVNPDDPPGRTVLCAEWPCWADDATWNATPSDLADRLYRSLTAIGLPDPKPAAVEVRRLPRVYPVYRPGFEWDMSTIELWLASDPRLVTLGRQGLFVPDNTHHALAMGWDAALALGPGDGGRFDVAAWTRARDRFRTNVVED
ncbi:MAG: protoporphyrinogen/coproporphyrinogen oxidase [Acidimicrobiales bacterium]